MFDLVLETFSKNVQYQSFLVSPVSHRRHPKSPKCCKGLIFIIISSFELWVSAAHGSMRTVCPVKSLHLAAVVVLGVT
jgi:hypothetical protein